MPIPITIPRLGWSMDEGVFGEWLKRDGEFVSAGEPLFLIESEKALQEVESIDEGILHIAPSSPREGDTVRVGVTIGYLLAEGEAPPKFAPAARESGEGTFSGASDARLKETRAVIQTPGEPWRPGVGSVAAADSPGSVAASPAVRRLARELGVDLRAFTTSGRISESDVRRAASQSARATQLRPMISEREIPRRNAHDGLPPISPRAARMARTRGVDWTMLRGTGRRGRIRECDILAAASLPGSAFDTLPMIGVPGRLKPASPVRRTIARRMLAGVHQTAPVTLFTKADATGLVALRERLRNEAKGSVPTYTDILIKFVADLLPECPELNACWVEDGVYVYNEINIALGVDTESGLMAPVLRSVARKSFEEIAAETAALIERARSGQLREQELQGGTFTLTNLGMFDVDAFTPILNLPQAAILGVGRIADEGVVHEGVVVARKTISLSLTFDHRVIDGAPAARWLQRLKQAIESS